MTTRARVPSMCGARRRLEGEKTPAPQTSKMGGGGGGGFTESNTDGALRQNSTLPASRVEGCHQRTEPRRSFASPRASRRRHGRRSSRVVRFVMTC